MIPIVNASKPYFWEVPLPNILVNGRYIESNRVEGTAVLDTSTVGVGMPAEILDRMFGMVDDAFALSAKSQILSDGSLRPGASIFWAYPCDRTPDFAFVLGGHGNAFSLDGLDLNLGKVQPTSSFWVDLPGSHSLADASRGSREYCLSSIVGRQNVYDTGKAVYQSVFILCISLLVIGDA